MVFKNLGSGDRGRSRLGKKFISKTSTEIEALGSLDELNSLLGLIRAQKIPKEFRNILLAVQKDLFIIQASIANILFCDKATVFKKEKIIEIENLIDSLSKKIGELNKFIIPGENRSSAWLDYARAVTRRTERRVLLVKKADKNSIAYLNRLSSLLFVMARFCVRKK